VAAELALTARNVSGEEAVGLRLASSCWGSVEELHRAAEAAARQLAGKREPRRCCCTLGR
jgi:enoyl-CoA hydratase/carnithine racemase